MPHSIKPLTMYPKAYLYGFFMLFALPCIGQSAYNLSIFPMSSDSSHSSLPKAKLEQQFPSALERHRALQGFLLDLYDDGYIAASIDSMVKDSTQLYAYYILGSKYLWAMLVPGNVEEEILSSIGYREKLMKGKTFSIATVKDIQEKILDYCENNGHPFAAVSFPPEATACQLWPGIPGVKQAVLNPVVGTTQETSPTSVDPIPIVPRVLTTSSMDERLTATSSMDGRLLLRIHHLGLTRRGA